MENIDWSSLGFGYMKTDYNVRCVYKDGKWGPLTVSQDETITMHMAATCLHYGQEAFEGLKAYRAANGDIRLFRVRDNARRMISSGEYLKMAAPSEEVFEEAVIKAVKLNEKYIPPYGTGATLYIRPLLIGTGPQVGVKPAEEYTFMIFVMPVGPYYKTGFNPIKIIVDRDHDRAAPLGTGHIKAGGNYGASLISGEWAHQQGYPGVLYLDAKEKKYIDESGAANFFGIKDGKYITPASHSVLPSVTNASLTRLAEDMGLRVERRPVEFAEIPTFEEAGSCGTAAVISPIGKIFDPDNEKTYTIGDPGKPGPWTEKLYKRLTGIQFGDIEDPYGWVTIVE